MATDKKYTIVGVSKLNGEYKVRFANDIMRIKILTKHGHEDIRLAELPEPMLKIDAVKAIQHMDEFQDVHARCIIDEYIAENSPRATVLGPAVTCAHIEEQTA